MKVKELIERLKSFPQEMEVNIFDYRKNLFKGGGDNCSEGVEKINDISIVPDDETLSLMEEYGEIIKQWVAIGYENDDYTENSTPNIHGDFSDYVNRMLY